ncbi:hypothetical protein [Gordonia crocea]|uniref:Uncharacterized protein n=1 Tax=Gordonia crocea TaxID=589162 RepID=A0A7I9V0C4_9ACTN|nr:hypothetical protein [Gordonia crocea]GED98878.1 hypothetical protein nbrc107697_29170 [Gordonia crocea]
MPAPHATSTPTDTAPDTTGRTIPLSALIQLIVGTALLVAAAAALPRLSGWADDHGTIVVFLAFFLLMSLAGRWFWAGIDTLIAAVKGHR